MQTIINQDFTASAPGQIGLQGAMKEKLAPGMETFSSVNTMNPEEVERMRNAAKNNQNVNSPHFGTMTQPAGAIFRKAATQSNLDSEAPSFMTPQSSMETFAAPNFRAASNPSLQRKQFARAATTGFGGGGGGLHLDTNGVLPNKGPTTNGPAGPFYGKADNPAPPVMAAVDRFKRNLGVKPATAQDLTGMKQPPVMAAVDRFKQNLGVKPATAQDLTGMRQPLVMAAADRFKRNLGPRAATEQNSTVNQPPTTSQKVFAQHTSNTVDDIYSGKYEAQGMYLADYETGNQPFAQNAPSQQFESRGAPPPPRYMAAESPPSVYSPPGGAGRQGGPPDSSYYTPSRSADVGRRFDVGDDYGGDKTSSGFSNRRSKLKSDWLAYKSIMVTPRGNEETPQARVSDFEAFLDEKEEEESEFWDKMAEKEEMIAIWTQQARFPESRDGRPHDSELDNMPMTPQMQGMIPDTQAQLLDEVKQRQDLRAQIESRNLIIDDLQGRLEEAQQLKMEHVSEFQNRIEALEGFIKNNLDESNTDSEIDARGPPSISSDMEPKGKPIPIPTITIPPQTHRKINLPGDPQLEEQVFQSTYPKMDNPAIYLPRLNGVFPVYRPPPMLWSNTNYNNAPRGVTMLPEQLQEYTESGRLSLGYFSREYNLYKSEQGEEYYVDREKEYTKWQQLEQQHREAVQEKLSVGNEPTVVDRFFKSLSGL